MLEDDPDDPMRTAIRQMRGVFAQLERGLIRQRMAKGRREKKAQGGYVAGSPRFGLMAHDKALVVHEEEAQVIATIRRLRADGLSLRAIAGRLEADGVRSKRGGRWHPTTVAVSSQVIDLRRTLSTPVVVALRRLTLTLLQRGRGRCGLDAGAGSNSRASPCVVRMICVSVPSSSPTMTYLTGATT